MSTENAETCEHRTVKTTGSFTGVVVNCARCGVRFMPPSNDKAAALETGRDNALQALGAADQEIQHLQTALDAALTALREILNWPMIGDTTTRLVDIRAYAEAAITQADTTQRARLAIEARSKRDV